MRKIVKKWYKRLRKRRYWTRQGKSNWYYRYYNKKFSRRQFTKEKLELLNYAIRKRLSHKHKLSFRQELFREHIFELPKLSKKNKLITFYRIIIDKKGKKHRELIHKEILKPDTFFMQLRNIFSKYYDTISMNELFFTLTYEWGI